MFEDFFEMVWKETSDIVAQIHILYKRKQKAKNKRV